MLNFIPVDKMPITVQHFSSVSIEFARLPSPNFVYCSDFKGTIDGYVSHIDFAKAINSDENIKSLIKKDFEKIVGKWNTTKKSHIVAIKKEVASLLLNNSELKVVFVYNRDVLCGVCERFEADVSTIEVTTLSRWLMLTKNGWTCIPGWLINNEYNRIGVYSEAIEQNVRSIVDTMLISELNSSDELKVSVISNTLTSPGNLPITKIENIDDLHDVDCVVVADEKLVEKVSFMVQEKADVPVISLSAIINDTYRAEIYESRMVEALVRLQNRGVHILVFATPIVKNIINKSEWEQYLIRTKTTGGFPPRLKENFELSGLSLIYNTYEDYITSLKFKLPGTILLKDNYAYAVSKDIGVDNAPDKPDNICYVFSESTFRINSATPDKSVPFRLQQLINECCLNVRVVNNAMNGSGIPNQTKQLLAIESEINAGDYVVINRRTGGFSSAWFKYLHKNNLPYYDSQTDFQRPHDLGETFIASNHINEIGAAKCAELVFRELFKPAPPRVQSYNFVSYYRKDSTHTQHSAILEEWFNPVVQSTDFHEYISKLKSQRKTIDGKIGSIVMNCNPFTLGHQYLIDTCAKKVEFLYIFVVEEDRSVFPFSDRIELVRKGVAHLPNVEVLPSGNFIISTLTFPEYFEKGDKQEEMIDPSNDVELFGKHIAPALGITIRFAGDEPLDNVTRQYNESMTQILPRYNIAFTVIPRKESDNEVISASRVRKLLAEGNFDAIAKLVPNTTLDYLKSL
jgi:[citrate (pro-3S)-lyase] ligase